MNILKKFKTWYVETENAQKAYDKKVLLQKKQQQKKMTYDDTYKALSVELADVVESIKENLNIQGGQNPCDLFVKYETKTPNAFCYRVLCNRTNTPDSNSFVTCSDVKELLKEHMNKIYSPYKFNVYCDYKKLYYYITIVIKGNKPLPIYTGNRGTLWSHEYLIYNYKLNNYQLLRDIYLEYPDNKREKLTTGKKLEILEDYKWMPTTVEDYNGYKQLSRYDVTRGYCGRLSGR